MSAIADNPTDPSSKLAANLADSSLLYEGKVMHQRFFPMRYRFDYSMLSFKINIDHATALAESLRFFSLNRFNLFSLRQADFGARNTDQSWREWADELLKHYGISAPAHKIELVCFPRFLGMGFNPLAMWYAYNEQDQLIAIMGETSNTYGQWHHYVLTNQGAPLPDTVKARAKKVFHVTPFLGMDCHYQFRFSKPNEHYRLHIAQTENLEKVLLATQNGNGAVFNDKTLLKAALKHPFSSIKALVLIHWWAIKIWKKGGQFQKTPPHLNNVTATHSEMTLC